MCDLIHDVVPGQDVALRHTQKLQVAGAGQDGLVHVGAVGASTGWQSSMIGRGQEISRQETCAWAALAGRGAHKAGWWGNVGKGA